MMGIHVVRYLIGLNSPVDDRWADYTKRDIVKLHHWRLAEMRIYRTATTDGVLTHNYS